MKILGNKSFQIISLIGLLILSGPIMPIEGFRMLYTISIIIKDVLIYFLPLAIGTYIATTLAGFRSKAPLLILILVIFEAFSNATSVWYAYGMGWSMKSMMPALTASDVKESLTPYISLSQWKPAFWSVDKGTIAGVVFGLTMGWERGYQTLFPILSPLKKVVDFAFTRVLSPIIPIFVLGFVANMIATGMLNHMITYYASIVFVLTIGVAVYLFILYTIAAGFSLEKTAIYLKNTLPTGAIAFMSMSSAATMPFTIAAAEKNLRDPDFARMVIPATTNIQQVGDCIINCFLCLVIMKNFGMPFPTLDIWVPFLVVFTLARYATAAVMGGAIFIMLPIYEAYLGFNGEMTALILAFNVILDPIVTSSNVMANGALAIIFEKVWMSINHSFPKRSRNKA